MNASVTLPNERITTEDALRALYPGPVDLIRRKQLSRLDKHCRRFIELSPLVMVATSGTDGSCDVSPRGDAPGFVRILDDRHVAIPDRKGNNRVDALRNIVANPHAGLLFLIPGINDLLRVNGAASVVTDAWLLSSMAVDGHSPGVAIVVSVQEAFLHCGRAFKRSRLWDPARFAPAGALPSLAIMLADQTSPDSAENALLAESEQAPLY